MLFTALATAALAYPQGRHDLLKSFATEEERIDYPTASEARGIIGRSRFARRPDGSFAQFTQAQSPDGKNGWHGSIGDFIRGSSIDLEPFTRSKITGFCGGLDLHYHRKSSVVTCADLEAMPSTQVRIRSDVEPPAAVQSVWPRGLIRVELTGAADKTVQ